MGKEPLRVAGGAAVDDGDVVEIEASIFELMPVRCDQVEVNLRTEVAMAGGALVQKQKRVLDVNGVGVEDLFE